MMVSTVQDKINSFHSRHLSSFMCLY